MIDLTSFGVLNFSSIITNIKKISNEGEFWKIFGQKIQKINGSKNEPFIFSPSFQTPIWNLGLMIAGCQPSLA